MKQIIVTKNEAGQRLDKLLFKYLNKAPKSFVYKMLRKKNITLNGKKAAGDEKTKLDDEIKLFLSDETVAKFSELHITSAVTDLDILYEDDHLLLINKPCGMLSQKSSSQDLSVVEYMISYLLKEGNITVESLQGFKPGICNRLDRNTSGIVVGGKSLIGLQQLNTAFKERSLHKYYLCIVAGTMEKEQTLNGYLKKDPVRNQVMITNGMDHEDAKPIHTHYRPISTSANEHGCYTLLEVTLITGRSHQIRAHLASAGHPIIGDGKYGNLKINNYFKTKYHLNHQLLHSYRLVMPKFEGELAYLSGQTFTAWPPGRFEQIRKECGLHYGNMELPRA